MKYNILPYGESAALVQFLDAGTEHQSHALIQAFYERLRTQPRAGVISLIPAYSDVTVVFHPRMTTFDQLKALILKEINQLILTKPLKQKVFEVPVCYDLGLDVTEACQALALSKAELIQRHTAPDYLIRFIGFVPGFAYMSGLDASLGMARHAVPRLKVPQGSVAIGGNQTGVYPLETPGGWQIIGNCPIHLLDARSLTPYGMGDWIRFYSISKSEHKRLKTQQPPLKYQWR